MNKTFNYQKEFELSLKDVLWELLTQWKALLTFCLIISLLLTGYKYSADKKYYVNEFNRQKELEQQASQPLSERIDAVLSTLPAKDQSAVKYILQQQDAIDEQKQYLENSILLHAPTDQRTLVHSYAIQAEGETDALTISDAYDTYLHDGEFIEELRSIIDPGASTETIYELILGTNDYTDANDRYRNNAVELRLSSNSAIYEVSCVLPEAADIDTVSSLIDSTINKAHTDISSLLGAHSIKKIDSEEKRLYNGGAAGRRTSIMNMINNLTTNIFETKGSLTVEQQAALEQIATIKLNANAINENLPSEETSAASAPQTPGISKKYSVVGFILGAFIYVFLFIAYVFMRRALSFATMTRKYTGSRLLGELYYQCGRKGLGKLFSSNIVAKYRYGKKLNLEKQLEALIAPINAMCDQYGAANVALVPISIDECFSGSIDKIVEKCFSGDNGRQASIVSFDDEINEDDLVAASHAILLLSNNSSIDRIGKALSLCSDYELSSLGSIYMEKL